MTLTPQQAHDLIAFYVETGVDVALDETPRDRLSEPAAAAPTTPAPTGGLTAQAPLPRAAAPMPAPAPPDEASQTAARLAAAANNRSMSCASRWRVSTAAR